MKNIFFFAAIFFAVTLFGQTKTFKGAWFDIKYPAPYTAKGSLKSATSDKGYESAFFESPDHTVEFYVFAPQWSGNPTDISLKNNVKVLSTDTQNTGTQVSRWWTIVAKNGSYTRSYQELPGKKDNDQNTLLIFELSIKIGVPIISTSVIIYRLKPPFHNMLTSKKKREPVTCRFKVDNNVYI